MAFTDGSLFDGEEEATNDYSSFWQSIPDPPTPEVAAAAASDEQVMTKEGSAAVAKPEGVPRRRNRKRDSFAFRDVTNRQEVSNGEENDSSLGKKPAVAVKSSASATKSIGVADDTFLGASIQLEGGGDIVEKRNKKRKKPRQSLLLPSDGESTDLLLQSRCSSLKDDEGKIAAIPELRDGSRIKERTGTSGASEQEVLLNYVRGYCSLPVECRANSKEANNIESLSRYPMPGKVRPIMDNATTREEFLLRVQPIVQQMEDRKKKDAADTRLATQCEVKKIGRGGYAYFDVNNGEPIHPDEYKVRYAAMLDKRHLKRKANNCVEECPTKDPENERNNLGIIEAKRSNKSDDSNMDMDDSVNMDDSMMSLDDSVSSDGEKQSPSVEQTPSTDDKIASNNVLGDSLVEVNSSPNHTDAPDETPNDDVGASQPSQHDNICNSHPLLAGMPASEDPRVMAARRKLFRAFDTALSKYSQEILAIEESDSADTTNNPNN